MKDKLTQIINDISKEILENANLKENVAFNIVIPERQEHGDFSCNIAMQLVKYLKKNPKIIAEEICQILDKKMQGQISCEIAGPGFINIKISKEFFAETVINIINDDKYFYNNIGSNKKALVEFVSANPTGPLHIGHGRGAAYGDSVARLLAMSGYIVTREYYVNDAGNQMNNLALSVYSRIAEILHRENEAPFPNDGYHGDYIKNIAKDVIEKRKDILDIDKNEALTICLETAVNTIQKNIDSDLKDFRVKFHNYFSEKSLYKDGLIEKALAKLKDFGKIYEKDGALWLNTSSMGDDKDRVLKKTTGEYTYFTPDIAYHQNKYDRGFDYLVDILGADHHGYVKRMQVALECLNHDVSTFKPAFIQMVNLIQNGEKISMSTRSGDFIPLSYLIDEVGIDAARFFYNMRSHDAQFDFDIDLAKSKSNDNPVYYIQYAHARVHSLINNAREKGITYEKGKGLNVAICQEEVNLIKNMIRLKYVIENAALYLEPHRVSYHLQELAAAFHSYYYSNKILNVDNEELTCGRLTICEAVAITLKTGLEILGVSAPERM